MKRIILLFLSVFIIASALPIGSVAVESGEAELVTDAWDGSYDMSWYDSDVVSQMLSPSSSSSPKKSIKLDGISYYVTTYKEGSQFVIKTAEQLAGLAMLVNKEDRKPSNTGTKGWFYNCEFLIALDVIDLSGHDWTPIGDAAARYFAGTLVGAAPNNENGAVIIRNMTVNTGAGLAGYISGGGIENITLENAKINATGGNIGSFVGYIAAGNLENLSSDADIRVSGESEPQGCYVGGIVGNTYNSSITACVFTGSIANGGAISGGIIGRSDTNNLTVSSCAVSSSNIRAEYNYNIVDPTKPPMMACGGIIGCTANEACAVSIENCYVNSNLGGVNFTGGIIGLNSNAALINIDNCQFEGIISAEKLMAKNIINQNETYKEIENTDNGSFIGASLVSATINLTDCVNTGVAASYAKGADAEFSFIGSIASGSTLNLSNNYSAIDVPYVIGEGARPSLLDGNEDLELSKWNCREQYYPVLALVSENTEIIKATAIYSCFNNGAVILTAREMQGLVNVLVACGESAENYLKKYDYDYTGTLVEATCDNDDVKQLLKSKIKSVDNTGDFIVLSDNDGILAQKTTDRGEFYNVRVIAKIRGNDYKSAGFEYMMSYVDAYGVTHYSSVQRIDNITQCYSSVLALDENGNTYVYYADDDTSDGDEYYFIGFVLTDLDKSVDYSLYVAAELLGEDRIIGQAVTFEFDAIYEEAA